MLCSPRFAPAAARLGCAAEHVDLADGCARAPDGRSLAFAELTADGVRVMAAFGNDNRLTYTYGSAAAHVAVDPGTGDVELLDCLVVEDVGRIVNPLTLHGQAIGGLVQGLGGAFLEHLVYDANGQLLAGNLADYLIPTATDFPKIRAIALENHRSPSNPLGVKGAGEGAIIPMGGLMANAVANALTSLGAMPNHGWIVWPNSCARRGRARAAAGWASLRARSKRWRRRWPSGRPSG